MLIQIPVTIHFDADLQSAAAGQRTFTLRYDTTDTERPAQWCDHYPPRPTSHWITDEQGVFFDLLPSRTDRTIGNRAEQDPQSYQVKEGV